MRKLLYGLIGLVVIVIGAALIVPSLIDWNGYKSEIAAQVKDATGRDLTIGGDLDLGVLPSPHLLAADVRLANAPGASSPDMARLKTLEVDVRLMPLLSGRVEVASVRLVEPVIELEKMADGRVNWQFAPPPAVGAGAGAPAPPSGQPEANAAGRPPGAGIQLDDIRIEGGTVIYRDRTSGTVERVEKIDARLSAASLSGPFRVNGTLTAHALPLAIDANVGALDGAGPVPVAIRAGLAGADGKIALTGSVADMRTDPHFQGRIEGDAADFAKLLDKVAQTGPLPPALAGKLDLAGGVKASAKSVAIDELDIRLGETRAHGGINVALGDRPRADVALTVNRVVVDSWIGAAAGAPARNGAPAAPDKPKAPAPAGAASSAGFALPAGIDGSLELTVQAVEAAGGTIRDAKLAASLNRGQVTVRQATARLPGGGSASLAGLVDTKGGQPAFDGALDVQADNLRGVFDWLKLDASSVPPDRLRKFSLAAKLKASPAELRILDVEMRLDASRLKGGAVVALRQRVGLGITLDLDHINLDAYLPVAAKPRPAPKGAASASSGKDTTKSTTAPASPLAVLETFDANMRAKIGVLTYRATPIRNIAFDGTLQSGKLTVRNAAIGDVAGSSAKVAGALSNLTGFPVFKGTFEAAAKDASALARLAGLDAGAVPRGLGKVALGGRADGNAEKLTVDTRLATAGGTVSLAGTLDALETAPKFDVTLTAKHPDAAALGRAIGVDLAAAGRGPLDLSTKLKGDLASVALDGKLALAGATADIGGTIAQPMTAPKLDLAARLAHPSLAGLAAALGASYRPTDAKLGPVSVAAKITGGSDKIDISAIDARAGKAQITGNAVLTTTGARPRLDAKLTGGEIAIDPFLPAPPPRRAEAAPDPALPVVPAGYQIAQAQAERWSRAPLDLAALGAVDADVTFDAKALSWKNVRVDNPHAAATLADKVLTLTKLTGKSFDGTFDMTGSLNAQATPTLTATVNVAKANVARALFEAASLDLAAGVLDFDANLKGQGTSEYALVSSLAGNGKLAVRDGTIKGFDLEAVNQRLANIDKPLDLITLFASALKGGATKFTSLDGTFRMTNGVMRTDDLKLTAPSGTCNAAGTVDLPRWQTDMTARLKVAANPNAPPIGVRVHGPLDAPTQTVLANDLQNYLIQKNAGKLLERFIPGAKQPSQPQTQQQPQAPTQQQAPAQQQKKPSPQDLLRGLLQGLKK